jgi:hypothetical protein
MAVTEADEQLATLRRRFEQAIDESFRPLLLDAGYTDCGVSFCDVEDPRDISLRSRFTRGRVAMEVTLVCVGLAVTVTRSEFGSAATCDFAQRADRVVGLERLPDSGLVIAKPKWLRHGTLEQEASASFARYVAKMNKHFNEAFAYLAERARATAGFV